MPKRQSIEREKKPKTNQIFCKYFGKKLDNLFETLFASEYSVQQHTLTHTISAVGNRFRLQSDTRCFFIAKYNKPCDCDTIRIYQ